MTTTKKLNYRKLLVIFVFQQHWEKLPVFHKSINLTWNIQNLNRKVKPWEIVILIQPTLYGTSISKIFSIFLKAPPPPPPPPWCCPMYWLKSKQILKSPSLCAAASMFSWGHRCLFEGTFYEKHEGHFVCMDSLNRYNFLTISNKITFL